MDDNVSRTSIDSSSTGDEYVLVNAEPRLRIANNGDLTELEKTLTEEIDNINGKKMASVEPDSKGDSGNGTQNQNNSPVASESTSSAVTQVPVTEKSKEVGQSTFYSAHVNRPRAVSSMEKNSAENADSSDTG